MTIRYTMKKVIPSGTKIYAYREDAYLAYNTMHESTIPSINGNCIKMLPNPTWLHNKILYDYYWDFFQRYRLENGMIKWV